MTRIAQSFGQSTKQIFSGGVGQLFFIKRIPNFGGKTKKWVKPSDPAKYDELISSENFFVPADFRELNSEIINGDLQEAQTQVLDPFFAFDQEAKHHQNRYFSYQWLLIIGSFVTTLFATITLANSSEGQAFNPSNSTNAPIVTEQPNSNDATAEPSEESSAAGGQIVNVSQSAQAQGSTERAPSASRESIIGGLVTAFVALITTIVVALNQQLQPQRQWYISRTIAEELRRHYFLYIAHLTPYNTIDHAEILESRVAEIKTHQVPQNQANNTAVTDPRPAHTDRDIELLIAQYRKRRVESQGGYYQYCIDEYKLNSNFVAIGTVVLGALAVFLTALNGYIATGQKIAIIIPLVPVFGVLLASFERIYGWARQRTLYEDALNRLTMDNTIPLRPISKSTQPSAEIMRKFISSVEDTLKAEMNQWGQNVLNNESSIANLTPEQSLELALNNSNLKDDAKAVIREMYKGKI